MNLLTPQTRFGINCATGPIGDNVNVEGFQAIALLQTEAATIQAEGFQAIALLNGWLGRNNLRYSQSFDTLVAAGGDATKWQHVGMAVDANVEVAPDGTTTAELVKLIAGANHYMYQVFSAGQRQYCFSIYVKQPASNRHRYFSIYISDGVSVNKKVCWDTDTWLTTTTDAGLSSATATSVGSGWYRLSVVYTYPGTYGTANFGPDLTTSTGSYTFAGTPGDGLYYWGAQVNPGDRPDTYCPTTTNALP